MPFPSRLLPSLAAAAAVSLAAVEAKEATMYVTCYSFSMPPATATVFGDQMKLSFTNPDSDEINDEWFLSGGTSEVSSVLVLDTAQGQLSAACTLRVPNSGDLDNNLLTDFFEVSKPVTAGSTTGEFTFDNGMEVFPGTLKATWNRAAGANAGTCQLQVSVPDFGIVNAKFNHAFEILQYKGTLGYTVAGTNVASTVQLKREGGATEFKGPFPMRQVSESELVWDATEWIGPGDAHFPILASDAIPDVPLTLDRAGLRTSDFYLGAFFFEDGNPATPFPDEYDLWEIVVIDRNDSDGDENPDLSDSASVVDPGPPPAFAVRTENGKLFLKVTGKAGQSVTLEQRTSLASGDWVPGQTVKLVSDVQEFDLGTPASPVFFVRGRL